MDSEDFKRGDYLYVDYGRCIHHGIYYGFDKVIHYRDYKIRKDPLKKFGDPKKILIKKYRRCSSPKKVISRAKKRLGEKRYNLLINNCEHFATWCKTGRGRCRQLERPERCLPKVVKHYRRAENKLLAQEIRRAFKNLK